MNSDTTIHANSNKSATTILLVDDEEALLDVLGTALTDSGYHCLRAGTAMAALTILSRTPEIDIIVSDIRMPGMDGIDLLKAIRERFSERKWLQVIFITGHATLDNSIAALRLEAVDFMHKPVRRVQLLEAVERAKVKVKENKQALRLWIEGRERLERLSQEIHYLTDMLMSAPRTNADNTQDFEQPAQDPFDPAQDKLSADRMLKLLQTRDIKTRYFTEKLFADPAWHMLLDLMENHLLSRQVSVSSLYIASGVSASTASRRLDEMEEQGLVQRWDDPNDGRRQYAKPTERAIELITAYLQALDKQFLP